MLAEHARRPARLAGRGVHHLRPRRPHLGRPLPGRRRARRQRRDRPPLPGPGRARPRLRRALGPACWPTPPAPPRRPTRSAGSTARARWSPGRWSTRPAASDADVVAFYPYLYHPTVAGRAARVADRAVLHPAAHDEPPLRLPLFRDVFGAARGLVFQTHGERRLVERLFPVAATPPVVMGLGVEPGEGDPAAARAAARARRAAPTCCASAGSTTARARRCWPGSSPPTRSAGPGPLALVLVGPVVDRPPAHPDIVVAGRVDEADKWGLLRGARALVSPSPYESFSLVLLEAWIGGRAGAGERPAARPPGSTSSAVGRRPAFDALRRLRGRASTASSATHAVRAALAGAGPGLRRGATTAGRWSSTATGASSSGRSGRDLHRRGRAAGAVPTSAGGATAGRRGGAGPGSRGCWSPPWRRSSSSPTPSPAAGWPRRPTASASTCRCTSWWVGCGATACCRCGIPGPSPARRCCRCTRPACSTRRTCCTRCCRRSPPRTSWWPAPS